MTGEQLYDLTSKDYRNRIPWEKLDPELRKVYEHKASLRRREHNPEQGKSIYKWEPSCSSGLAKCCDGEEDCLQKSK